LKEIELSFRKLLIDANLGQSQSLNVPFKATALPLEKMLSICRRFVQEKGTSLKDIDEKEELFLQLLEAAIKASKFLRMEDLKSEKDQLDEVPEDGDEKNQLMEIEKNSSSDESFVEDEGQDNEHIN